MNKEIQILHQKLFASKSVAIVSHSHPDGDAVGCCVALKHYLTDICGIKAEIVLPECPATTLDFLSKGEDIICANTDLTRAENHIMGSEIVVLLDGNAYYRTGDLESILKASPAFKVLIDHHPDPALEQFDLIFSTVNASSACEVLFRILMGMPEMGGDASKLPASSARALMSGMTTDTNNFANSVFPETLAMASALLSAGVDRDSIISSIYENYRENRFRLMGYLLGEKLHITPQGVAYIILDKATSDRFNISDGETEGFVNIPLGIGKVCISIFLTESDGHYRVSVRSKQGYEANTMAQKYFHGGGHVRASGGKLWFKNTEAIKADICCADKAADYVETIINDYFRHDSCKSCPDK